MISTVQGWFSRDCLQLDALPVAWQRRLDHKPLFNARSQRLAGAIFPISLKYRKPARRPIDALGGTELASTSRVPVGLFEC